MSSETSTESTGIDPSYFKLLDNQIELYTRAAEAARIREEIEEKACLLSASCFERSAVQARGRCSGYEKLSDTSEQRN